MSFQRSVRPSFLAVGLRLLPSSLLAIAVLAIAAPALAQVTGTTTSSQSNPPDVQTAQVVKAARELYTRDVAVSVFAQYTNRTNGNFLRLDTTSSGGGLVSYRQSPRWWLGYELNAGSTKYSDSYDKGEYRIDHQATEITAAYLLRSKVYHGVKGFFTFGGGAMIFSPSSSGGLLAVNGTPATQAVPLFVYSVGVEHNFTEHLGLRVQYRGDEYKAPNFKLVALDAHKLRTSDEPAVGIYYRF